MAMHIVSGSHTRVAYALRITRIPTRDAGGGIPMFSPVVPESTETQLITNSRDGARLFGTGV